jgi:hypothetical protein
LPSASTDESTEGIPNDVIKQLISDSNLAASESQDAETKSNVSPENYTFRTDRFTTPIFNGQQDMLKELGETPNAVVEKYLASNTTPIAPVGYTFQTDAIQKMLDSLGYTSENNQTIDKYLEKNQNFATPAVANSPIGESVDPFDFDMPAQYAANTAATTADTTARINSLMESERAADAAANAAAADAAIAKQDAFEKKQQEQAEKNAAIQTALENAPSISLGTSTNNLPAGTDLTGGISPSLGTGVSTPNGPDISGGYSNDNSNDGGDSGEGDGGDGGGDGGGGDGDGGRERGGGGDARGGYYHHGQFDYHPYAQGGIATLHQYNLGSYSDGGRLLKGPGDGVSDSIPATIGRGQPARLADGEFVIPARIVSELGNGSTDAGAKRLYEMMDRIQRVRRKTKNVAANTKAAKYLPA